jgi:hypothetical protein
MKPALTLNINQIVIPPTSPGSSVGSELLNGTYKSNYCLYKKEIGLQFALTFVNNSLEREILRSPTSDPQRGEEIEVKLEIEYTDLDTTEVQITCLNSIHLTRKKIFTSTSYTKPIEISFTIMAKLAFCPQSPQNQPLVPHHFANSNFRNDNLLLLSPRNNRRSNRQS